MPPDVARTVPNWVTDPAWCVNIWGVDVNFAGSVWHVKPMSASEWLGILWLDNYGDMVSELFSEDIFDPIADGLASWDELEDLLLDVVSTVTARPWWIGMRLAQAAKTSWGSLGGHLALKGVDAAKMPIGGWLDALTLLIVQNLSDESITMALSMIEAPPPSETVDSFDAMEMSESQFLSLASH